MFNIMIKSKHATSLRYIHSAITTPSIFEFQNHVNQLTKNDDIDAIFQMNMPDDSPAVNKLM